MATISLSSSLSASGFEVRLLTESELDDVMHVQKCSYEDSLLEEPSTFARKMELFPEGCVGLFDGTNLAAYAFAHPWTLEKVVPLDNASYTLPKEADCFYVHDVAVNPDYRKQGLASALFSHVKEIAQEHEFEHMALVSVQGSQGYWSRFGFKPKENFQYTEGVDAVWMATALHELQ